jgi:hypothetical protein
MGFEDEMPARSLRVRKKKETRAAARRMQRKSASQAGAKVVGIRCRVVCSTTENSREPRMTLHKHQPGVCVYLLAPYAYIPSDL